MAVITPDAGNPFGQIDPKTVRTSSDIDDIAALQICVQDAQRTESWQQNNFWGLRWREADALYQSPPGVIMWEGTTMPRANMNRYVVAETVNTIHEQVMNGLFYETPAFVLRQRPNADANVTRAITNLLSIQLDEMEIRQEVDWGLHSCLLFGTGIWKWGYESRSDEVPVYRRVGSDLQVPTAPGSPTPTINIETKESLEFEEVMEMQQSFRPTFENKDIRYVLVDPSCCVPDIRKAKFVIDRMYLTYRDLIKLANEEYVAKDSKGKKYLAKRYNLPSETEIREWFTPPTSPTAQPDSATDTSVQNSSVIHHATPKFQATTADPLDEPLEVLERWDNDKVITTIQRIKCIRNEPNEYRCIPFLSCNWWNITDAFWGLGLGRVIGVEQRIQAGLINACLDLANLIVNPMFIRAKGANIETQMIRQRIGGIITADGANPEKALTIVEQPTIPNEIIQQIALSEGRVEKSSGASQAFSAGATSKAGAARSGTGAAGMIQATMSRIGATAEVFVRQVFEPFLYKMHELNKRKTPMFYIRKLLGEELGDAYSEFDPQKFMDAKCDFDVLAGSHLAAKAQMAQSLFMMFQIFDNPAIAQQLGLQHKTVEIEEILHMIHDISGFKNYYNIIRKMTATEVQAHEAASQAAQAQSKLGSQMTLNNQTFNQKQQLVDQESNARVVREMFKDISKRSAEPQMLSGADPTQGVGSQESV